MSVAGVMGRHRWALGAGAAIAACLVLMGLLVDQNSVSANDVSRTAGGTDFLVTSTSMWEVSGGALYFRGRLVTGVS